MTLLLDLQLQTVHRIFGGRFDYETASKGLEFDVDDHNTGVNA